SPSDCLRHRRDWHPLSPDSPVRAPIGPPTPRPSGHVCRRCGAGPRRRARPGGPRLEAVWVETTTATQRQLVRLLDDDTTFIQTEGGAVVLDLRPIVIELGEQGAVIRRVGER